jgi:hypothetical protein
MSSVLAWDETADFPIHLSSSYFAYTTLNMFVSAFLLARKTLEIAAHTNQLSPVLSLSAASK